MTDREMAIQSTAMAIREILMEFFKGSCVQKVIAESNVTLQATRSTNQYQYERQRNEKQQKSILYIGSAPLLYVQHVPDKVTFNRGVCNRSPELREVTEMIEDFLEKYLPIVETRNNNQSVLKK